MTSRSRFVRYTSQKVPRTVAGSTASSIDPATWSSYAAAEASTVGEGIGFVLGEGIGCLDLDHCISNGKLEPWAAVLLAANHNTYAEISRSGEGLHIFGYLPEGPGRFVRDGRNIEVYSTGRYIALTGNRFGQSPATLADLVVPALP